MTPVPISENEPPADMRGAVSRAKQGLAKSQSRSDASVRSPTTEQPPTPPTPPVKSEGELRWEEVRERARGRPLRLCDLDFTDLTSDDELDPLAPAGLREGQ